MQPLTEHLLYVKGFVEDLARIWLDILITYNDSIMLEEEQTDPMTGEKIIQLVEVQKDTLKALQAAVRVDITPKGAFDKYAQEQSLENLLTNGLFSTQRMPELKLYVKTLDDDSVMPKEKLETVVTFLLENETMTGNQFRDCMEGRPIGEAEENPMFTGMEPPAENA